MVENEGFSDRRPTVERPPEYLRSLIDYIHLNPVRAGMISPERDQSVLDYPWSSVARGYALPPTKRPAWLDTERGLGLVDCRDNPAGRRRYVERLDRRAAAEEAHRVGLPEGMVEDEGDRAAKRLSRSPARGWYWGSEAFRERMTNLTKELAKKKGTKPERFERSAQGRDHAEQMAEQILARALVSYGLKDEESLRELVGRGDWRRVSVAWAIWSRTSVGQDWIAERLNLRNAANVSQQVGRFSRVPDKDLPTEIREWKQTVAMEFS